MHIQIRKYKKSDLQLANKYLTNLIKEEKQYDDNINEKCTINSYYETCMDENHQIFFAEANGITVGYLYGFIQNNGNTVKEKVSEINAIYIEKQYRNIGIGKKLIEEFLKWSKEKDVKITEISVFDKNTKALNLYKKTKFKKIKTTLSLKLK